MYYFSLLIFIFTSQLVYQMNEMKELLNDGGSSSEIMLNILDYTWNILGRKVWNIDSNFVAFKTQIDKKS